MPNILKSFTNKVESIGFDHLHIIGKTIFISNHVSSDDVSALDHLLPTEVYFAIDSDYKNTYSDVLKKRKHIIYDLFNPKTLVELKKLVESNTPILLFPESKVSNTGSFIKIIPELADIALKTEANLFPILILGNENANYFPSQNMKIILEKPYQLHKKNSYSNEKQKEYASFQILRNFQENRFKHAMKKEVNLYNELLETAKKIGEKKVIIEDMTSSLTYKDFIIHTSVFYHKLKILLKGMDTIGVLLPTSIPCNLTLFSLFRLGITPAMLNFSMGEQNLKDCCETANLKTVITSREFIKKGELDSVIDLLSSSVNFLYLEDIKASISQSEKLKGLSDYTLKVRSEAKKGELILFTSGSESKPKGVILTHENIFANIHQAVSVIDITPKDILLNTLPSFHSFGLTAGSILPLLIGVKVFLYPSPLHSDTIAKLSQKKDATILFGTSTFFGLYGKNAHPTDFINIRLAVAGAEKLKDDVFNLWAEKFGVRILEGYGVTEASPILSLNTPMLVKRGSVGLFVPGIEYKVVPVEGIEKGGNLYVKGPNVMKGYLIHQKGFIPLNDWYDCGDIVDVDEDGFVHIISRLKRFAKVGGEMVSLNLIEDLASKCFERSSSQIAAVAIADKKKGEKIILFVTDEQLKYRDLKKYIKNNKHSSLLIPKDIQFVPSLPLLGSGKTDYVSLTQLAKDID